MKISYLPKLAAICVAGALLISCSGDDESPSTPDTPVSPVDPVTPEDPVKPEESEAMSPLEQKTYLEETGLEFVDQVPSADFKYYVDFSEYLGDTYIEEYDWDNIGDWASDSFKAIKKFIESTNPESGTIYDNYKALVEASNFTGCFTATNGKWVYTEDNCLRFIFTDKNKKECELKLVTEGEVTKVHYGEMKEYNGYKSGNRYYDITDLTIGVPESIIITLTEGGNTLTKITLDTKLSEVNNEEFNISKSGLSATFAVLLDNGYQLLWTLGYSGNDSVSTSLFLYKNNTALVTVAVGGDISDIPSWNVSDIVNSNVDEAELDDINAKNAFVKIDILGKVQVQGVISNVRKYVDYLEKADDNEYDESNFKSYLNQANSLADVDLFYDGTSVKQASLKLEPFSGTNSRGTYWYMEPVIYFYDGSSYSTFEAFFDENDFTDFIDAVEKLIEDYENLL